MNDTEQENEKVTIRKARIQFGIGSLLPLLGVGVLFASIGADTMWGFVGGLAGCFACGAVGVVMVLRAAREMDLSKIRQISQKYGRQELTKLPGMKKMDAQRTLQLHGFQMEDSGYYRKKEFSLGKDSVTYYVKILDSSDMEATVQNACNDFDGQFQDDYHNLCLILLVYSGESELDILRKIGIDHIQNNMVRCRQSARTLVVAQVDPVTGIGQYLDIGKGHGLCLFSYGCKMLKKLFGQA